MRRYDEATEMQQDLAELRGNEEEGNTNPLQNGNEQRIKKRRD